MGVINGEYFNGLKKLESSYTIVSCHFINCSSRGIFLNSSNSFLFVSYSFFENCSSRDDSIITESGGCIFGISYKAKIQKCRSFLTESNGEGSFSCTFNQKASLSQISIFKIRNINTGHYCLKTREADSLKNINVTEGVLKYDIGFISDAKDIKFISYKNLTGRTLFRNHPKIKYGNIIDSSATAFSFNSLDIENFYLININVTSVILSLDDSLVNIKDSVFINVKGIEESDNVIITKTHNSGQSYNCLDRIPLDIKTLNCKHNCRNHAFTIAIAITLTLNS